MAIIPCPVCANVYSDVTYDEWPVCQSSAATTGITTESPPRPVPQPPKPTEAITPPKVVAEPSLPRESITPFSPQPVQAPIEDDEWETISQPIHSGQYSMTRLGLLLVLVAIVYSFALILSPILLLVAVRVMDLDPPDYKMWRQSAIMVVALVQLLALVGKMHCLTAAGDVDAVAILWGSVLIDILGFCVFVGQVATSSIPEWVRQTTDLMQTGGALLFLLFLGRLASLIGDGLSAARANDLIRLGCLLFLLELVSGWLYRTLEPGLLIMMILVALMLFVVGIWWVIKYVRLLNGLRASLE